MEGGAPKRRNLDCMTKKDLIALAKERKNPIPGLWKLKKDELVAAMRSSKKTSAKPKSTKN